MTLSSPGISAESDFTPLWDNVRRRVLPVMARYRQHIDGLDVRVKKDSTLLTDADTEVQGEMVAAIREFDPLGRIVAEEDSVTDALVGTDVGEGSAVWVVDPIDGTSQFVDPAGREYCSVVAVLVEGMPVACAVLAPEFGRDRSLVGITAATAGRVELEVNGVPVASTFESAGPRWVSTTRDVTIPPRRIEHYLADRGYSLKTRTTSQTLDLVRTTVPLGGVVDGPPFDLFYREDQKIWDGVAGMCLALVAGLTVTTLHSKRHLPVGRDMLVDREPTFRSTLVGRPGLVAEVVDLLGE